MWAPAPPQRSKYLGFDDLVIFIQENVLKFSTYAATSCSSLVWLAFAGLAQAQQPALPNNALVPSPKPGITTPLQPTIPNRPLDANPLNPMEPSFGNPTGLKNKCFGSPVRITLEVVPATVRSGTPVELRITTQCPTKETQSIEFSTAAPGSNTRSAGEAMVAFLNQIPRSNINAGSSTATVRFTPRGLTNSVSLTLTAQTLKPLTVTSNSFAVRIEGDGVPVAPAISPAAECRPTLSLNMIPNAVIGGASVPVDLRLTCALTQDATVQIISSNETLLPGPPANLVRIPAGQTAMQFQLIAGRTGPGTVTLRALLSHPAIGGMTPADSLSISR